MAKRTNKKELIGLIIILIGAGLIYYKLYSTEKIEIEEKKANAELEKTPQEINNELLSKLNDNLTLLNERLNKGDNIGREQDKE